MLIVVSPAKSLDYTSTVPDTAMTEPLLMDQAQLLIDVLKHQSVQEVRELMDISEDLGQLNVQRFRAWQRHPDPATVRQAIFAFNGDVYEGLAAASLSADALNYLQNRLRILSGLYGVLRPLDALQAYRLEMGGRLATDHGKNLYTFWGRQITDVLRNQMEALNTDTLVNLASDEYFKSVKVRELGARVITPQFYDWKNGQYKIISFYAKRARGLMARFCAEQGLADPEQMKAFDTDGYQYCQDASDADRWVFRRRLAE